MRGSQRGPPAAAPPAAAPLSHGHPNGLASSRVSKSSSYLITFTTPETAGTLLPLTPMVPLLVLVPPLLPTKGLAMVVLVAGMAVVRRTATLLLTETFLPHLSPERALGTACGVTVSMYLAVATFAWRRSSSVKSMTPASSKLESTSKNTTTFPSRPPALMSPSRSSNSPALLSTPP